MNTANQSSNLFRTLIAGLAGGLAWFFAMMLFFGPAQSILANPDYQSQKFLSVFTEIEPLPHTFGSVWILPATLLLIGMLYGFVYHFIRRSLPVLSWWKAGISFGVIAWVLMVPWFEFYLPWNVMHEPLLLVLFEGILWLAVLLCAGLAIAGVYEWPKKKAAASKP